MALTEFLRGQPPTAPPSRANGVSPREMFAFRVERASSEAAPGGVTHPWYDVGGRLEGDLAAVDEEFESLIGDAREGDFLRAVGSDGAILAFGLVHRGRGCRVHDPVDCLDPDYSGSLAWARALGGDWVRFWSQIKNPGDAMSVLGALKVPVRLCGGIFAELASELLPYVPQDSPTLTAGLKIVTQWSNDLASAEMLERAARPVLTLVENLRDSDLAGGIEYSAARAVYSVMQKAKPITPNMQLTTGLIATTWARADPNLPRTRIDRMMTRRIVERMPLPQLLFWDCEARAP